MSARQFRGVEIEFRPYQSGKEYLCEVWLDGQCHFPSAPITAACELAYRKVFDLEGKGESTGYYITHAPFVYDDGGRST